ncbi:hypothetical protein BDW71DRAFT_87015 [Aspergillus fruticulosus]
MKQFEQSAGAGQVQPWPRRLAAVGQPQSSVSLGLSSVYPRWISSNPPPRSPLFSNLPLFIQKLSLIHSLGWSYYILYLLSRIPRTQLLHCLLLSSLARLRRWRPLTCCIITTRPRQTSYLHLQHHPIHGPRQPAFRFLSFCP